MRESFGSGRKTIMWLEVGGYDTINSVNSTSKEGNDA
jgi:hypothetical protein